MLSHLSVGPDLPRILRYYVHVRVYAIHYSRHGSVDVKRARLSPFLPFYDLNEILRFLNVADIHAAE